MNYFPHLYKNHEIAVKFQPVFFSSVLLRKLNRTRQTHFDKSNFKGLEEASRVWYIYIIHRQMQKKTTTLVLAKSKVIIIVIYNNTLTISYNGNDIHSNVNDIHDDLLGGCGLSLISSMESWNLWTIIQSFKS